MFILINAAFVWYEIFNIPFKIKYLVKASTHDRIIE